MLDALTLKAPHLCVNARSILCDLDQRTVAAADARNERELETGEEQGFVHGNTGLMPVNRLDPALIAKIQLLINKYSWFDPGVRTKDGLCLRRPTNERANGWGGLWGLFEEDYATAAGQMTDITFKTHF